MNYAKTFRIDKLYHKFLKPKGIPTSFIESLASRLQNHGFILVQDDRYQETDKLTSREHRDELFKIIQGVKDESLK